MEPGAVIATILIVGITLLILAGFADRRSALRAKAAKSNSLNADASDSQGDYGTAGDPREPSDPHKPSGSRGPSDPHEPIRLNSLDQPEPDPKATTSSKKPPSKKRKKAPKDRLAQPDYVTADQLLSQAPTPARLSADRTAKLDAQLTDAVTTATRLAAATLATHTQTRAIFDHPAVLVCADEVSSFRELWIILGQAARQNVALLIAAPTIDADALQTVIANHLGSKADVAVVLGDAEALNELAQAVATSPVTRTIRQAGGIAWDQLGTCERIVATEMATHVIGTPAPKTPQTPTDSSADEPEPAIVAALMAAVAVTDSATPPDTTIAPNSTDAPNPADTTAPTGLSNHTARPGATSDTSHPVAASEPDTDFGGIPDFMSPEEGSS